MSPQPELPEYFRESVLYHKSAIMDIQIIAYSPEHIEASLAIWNDVVRNGIAFPQEEELTAETGHAFFSAQTFTGLAQDRETREIVGLYILHPNNVGRCEHICNASYAVSAKCRGHHIGEMLVRHSLTKGKECGFRILQFNAVVRTNENALALYKKLGFVQLGVIPGGFRKEDGSFEDIIPHYYLL